MRRNLNYQNLPGTLKPTHQKALQTKAQAVAGSRAEARQLQNAPPELFGFGLGVAGFRDRHGVLFFNSLAAPYHHTP